MDINGSQHTLSHAVGSPVLDHLQQPSEGVAMDISGEPFDVIVVGAGIMGSCTAYEAAKRGLRVILLERFDFLHHLGSSHGESRTIRATYPESYYPPMVLESSRLWDAAQSEIGYQVITPTPQLDIGPSGNSSLRSLICSSSDQPIDLQVTDSLPAGHPLRLPDGWVGVSTSLGGVIKPTKAVAMFQSLALRRGAVLRDHMEVKEIAPDAAGCGVRITVASGERFHGKKCVVTAGAWTRKLVREVSGVELPIQPLHTTICYWKIKEGKERALSPEGGFPTFASYGDQSYIYGTPSLEFPGLIKIALHGGRPCDPDRREWSSASGVEVVAAWIDEVMPGCVETEKPVSMQGCMYSMTPDGDFVMDFLGGELGREVVVAGGFSGHGFKMGPVVGRILVDLAVEGEAKGVEMRHFRIARFEEDPRGNLKEFEDQVSTNHDA